MKLKKLVVLTLTGMLLLAGCANNNGQGQTTATPTPEAAKTEADVIVVGAGGAGMTAAIEAADAGKSVIVIEKMAMTGGNTTRSTGGMNAANTTEQKAMTFDMEKEAGGVDKALKAAAAYPELAELTATVQKQWDDFKANPTGYFDTEELFMLDTLVGGKNINNPELVTVMATQAKDAIEWLKTIDINLSQVGSFGGASVKRIHKPVDADGKTLSVGSYIVPRLTEAAKAKGVTFVMEMAATELVVTDGKVTGVKAGETTYTGKAVVLATGGFAYDTEMVLSYKPDYKGFVCTNAPGITGDGIKMAQAIGAGTVDMEQIQIHPTVHQETSALITEGLRGDGAILVNSEGNRFFDEVGTRDAVSAAEVAQPGGFAWLIVDSNMVEKSTVIAGYIKQSLTVEGETVEDLATAMGVDAAAFKVTMDKWNACVDAGKDEEFNRTSFANKLDKGPYYGIKVAPGVHHTMGGLSINTNTEVLDAAGAVIPGLFAAGEVTGGVHGANRLGGNAVADIIIFGRIAGQNAAKFAE